MEDNQGQCQEDGAPPTVEELRRSLEEKDETIMKLRRALKKVKGIFKYEWAQRVGQYKREKLELAQLLREEEELGGTVEELKRSMAGVSQQVREKEEEVRKLAKKVKRLKEGVPHQTVNLKDKAKDPPAILHGGQSAASILPEEVWKMILEELSDSQDLWNCTNTCQLFENLLRPWKTGWMLEQALPYLYKHLPGNKLMECRLVSKGWYAGVTCFFDHHPSTQPPTGNGDPRKLDVVFPLKEKCLGNNFFGFGPDEDLSALDKLFPKELARSPFIGRYASLHLRNPDGHEDEVVEVEKARWSKLYSFLKSHGKGVWHLNLCFPFEPTPLIREHVRELFAIKLFPLVPNLQTLAIGETGCTGVIINPEDLPEAPHLKTVKADLIDDDDQIVQALFRRYHMQLCSLQLAEKTWHHFHLLEWPNLAELLLYLGDVFGDGRGIDFSSLYGMRTPHLKRLTLSFQDVWELSFQDLILAVNSLATRTELSTLALCGPLHGIEFGQLDTAYFATGALKSLQFSDFWDEAETVLPSHNFLRCFPLLENLTVMVRIPPKFAPVDQMEEKYATGIDLLPISECQRRVAEMEWEDEFIEINKYLYDGQMYKSNIWVLLPRLKVFTFQWDVYTREEYEAYSRNRPVTEEVENGK